MRIFITTLLLGAACLNLLAGQYTVAERGAHHRILEKVQEVQTPRGLRNEANRIVELQGGLHRWTEQGWVEAHPRIELFQDGAVIQNLQYGAIFAPNLATPNAIDLSLPAGAGRVQAHLLGLALTEGNQSVLIAEVKDCAGVIGGPEQNELTFADAMTDFAVSVKYIAQRERLSQIVLIEQQLPHPSEWGLTENAVLEVLTELTAFPEMRKEPREPIDGIAGEHLSFASMEFITGKAFSVGDEANAVSVQKKMELFEGQRWFLVEKVPWRAIAAELAKLPPVAKNWRKKEGQLMARDQLRLPKRQQARAAIKPIRMASSEGVTPFGVAKLAGLDSGTRVTRPFKPAYVLDWELVTSVNSNLWKADTTYYIAGGVTIKTNIFEGGCVIKYAPTNFAKLTITGPVTCLSTNYAPIIMTARDDHSIGGAIGAASLSGYYASVAMELDYGSSGAVWDLHHLRISHATTGLSFPSGGRGHIARDVQFVRCGTGMGGYNPTFSVLNALFHGASSAFSMSPSSSVNTGIVQHVTFNQCTNLDTSGLLTLFATNSLFLGMTNMASFTGAYNGTNDDPSAVVQTVGGGANYLAASSIFKNAGTTNINSGLLGDLRRKTTAVPVVISNTITANTILEPQAQRDTDVPDLGYHYDPIDFALGLCGVTNATLTLTNGVAMATFDHVGVAVFDNAQIISQGTAQLRNQICRYNTVQEQSTNWGGGTAASHTQVYGYRYGSTAPNGYFRFTDFSGFPNGGSLLYTDDSSFLFGTLVIRDCGFNSGRMDSGGGDLSRVGITNNLFYRVDLNFLSSPELNVRNNLFIGASCVLAKTAETNTWTFKDNSFDGVSIEEESAEATDNSYNAYINCPAQLSSGANNVVTNSFTYHGGPLGRFYQPTNSALVNTGSVSDAALAGLYHYTTTTNQVKETNSWIDIGYHYVATDANGVPLDGDGDGLADYLEDADGDGVLDGTEPDFTVVDTDGDGVSDYLEWLQGRNPRAGAANDTNGVVRLRVFTPLK